MLAQNTKKLTVMVEWNYAAIVGENGKYTTLPKKQQF
jgi:hypothetical protein